MNNPVAQPEKSISKLRSWRWVVGVMLIFLGLGIAFASRLGGNDAADPNVELVEIKKNTGGGSSDAPLSGDETAGDDADESFDADAEKFAGRIVGLVSAQKIAAADHPIDPLLELAEEGLRRIDADIRGYTTTLISQARTGDTLQPQKKMFCKIRHARGGDEQTDGKSVPMSVYLKMESPSSEKGQEVIWVEGQNNNKIIAHAAGFLNVKRVYLEPNGSIAMSGNRYPIWDIGFKNLLAKMKAAGEKDRLYGECTVEIERDVLVADRLCTLITLTHPEKRPHFLQHIAKIYVDQQIDVLVGYEGYLWPETPGGAPVLQEKYFYTELQVNPGLSDDDFSPSNSEYNFPSF